ncbi:MAG: cytidylate kinase [Bdellovibrionaceae bacterium]|nr:cytidylate kinase [Pseudobdellovibrionaceae bacterium]
MGCIVVTIDGPAASGKTSVSRGLAQKLGWKWVSTGAFYRGLGYMAQQTQVDIKNEDELVALVKSDNWSVQMNDENTNFIFNDQDVTEFIFQEEVGTLASQVSGYPKVREALLEAQRALASEDYNLVAEGRDCGSVVFPTAPLKVYLTARSESRAQRRAEEQGKDLESTIEAQKQRDQQDASRKAAPMQVPEGAHVIDTSELTLDQVVQKVEDLVQKHIN